MRVSVYIRQDKLPTMQPNKYVCETADKVLNETLKTCKRFVERERQRTGEASGRRMGGYSGYKEIYGNAEGKA